MKEIKKVYITPEVEITKFSGEDVITTSSMGGGQAGDVNEGIGGL